MKNIKNPYLLNASLSCISKVSMHTRQRLVNSFLRKISANFIEIIPLYSLLMKIWNQSKLCFDDDWPWLQQKIRGKCCKVKVCFLFSCNINMVLFKQDINYFMFITHVDFDLIIKVIKVIGCTNNKYLISEAISYSYVSSWTTLPLR